MLEFQCPHCKTVLSIPEQFIGTEGTCRKCNKPIKIEAEATLDPVAGEGSSSMRPPTLIAFHCETTGPSARKCNITELAGIKFDLNAHELDSFSSFADPGHLIPPRISEKTGITDEMIQGSPPSNDVVKGFVDWIGPHVILLSHHALFDSKFVAGTLLKEDLDPPRAHVVDVIHWARSLEVPVEQYRLRNLLDFIGYPVKNLHRALETCHGIVALVHSLSKREAGAHMEIDKEGGVWGRLTGKKTEAVNAELAYRILKQKSRTLEEACGQEFYEKVRYEARLKRVKSHSIASGGMGPNPSEPVPGQPKHSPVWYEQMSHRIRAAFQDYKSGKGNGEDFAPGNAPWEYTLLEASQTKDRDQQKSLCQQAVSLGAIDPWPYERLVHVYIKEKEYEAAQLVCEQFFESGTWKAGRWSEVSQKLLKRMEKLERKIAEKARA